MKILKNAICGVIVSSLLSSAALAFDLQKLTTKSGKVYYQIEIIDADKHGLLFRHSKGIAKESFPFLSNSVRDMFEPVGDVPQAALPTDKGGSKTATSAKGEKAQAAIVTPVVLSVSMSQPVVSQRYFQTGCYQHSYANYHPSPYNWPSHWHRFHPAHYLTNPICRAQVTQNFLHATGLLLPQSHRVINYRYPFSAGSNHFPVRAIHAPIRVTRPPVRVY